MQRPQLSLRDLFWLVLVCALVVGWWVDHRQQAATNRRVTEMLFEAIKVEPIPTFIVPIGGTDAPVRWRD